MQHYISLAPGEKTSVSSQGPAHPHPPRERQVPRQPPFVSIRNRKNVSCQTFKNFHTRTHTFKNSMSLGLKTPLCESSACTLCTYVHSSRPISCFPPREGGGRGEEARRGSAARIEVSDPSTPRNRSSTDHSHVQSSRYFQGRQTISFRPLHDLQTVADQVFG